LYLDKSNALIKTITILFNEQNTNRNAVRNIRPLFLARAFFFFAEAGRHLCYNNLRKLSELMALSSSREGPARRFFFSRHQEKRWRLYM
jgi:hypothetical protein